MSAMVRLYARENVFGKDRGSLPQMWRLAASDADERSAHARRRVQLPRRARDDCAVGTKEMIDGMFARVKGRSRRRRVHRARERPGSDRLARNRGLGLAGGLRSVVRQPCQSGVPRGAPLPSIAFNEQNAVLTA